MRLYLLITCLVLAMVVPVIIFDEEIDAQFGGERGLEYLREFGQWAWLVGIGLIVSDLLIPMPSTAVISGLGMLYGPWLGGFLGGVGSILAGVVGYVGCRMLGKRVVNILMGDTNLEKLQKFFDRYGTWAIALSRWMPLLPEALACLAGMARMPFGRFMAALTVGSLAMGFSFALLGMAYVDRPVVGIVISAMIPVAVWPIVHAFFRKREQLPVEVDLATVKE